MSTDYGHEDISGSYYECDEVNGIDFDTFDAIISRNPVLELRVLNRKQTYLSCKGGLCKLYQTFFFSYMKNLNKFISVSSDTSSLTTG